jgi:hypothetical protein
MSVYTPEIYRRFATPLTLNLGPTAEVIDETRKLVEQVKVKTDPLPDIEQKLTDTRTVIEGAVNAAKNELLPKLVALEVQVPAQSKAVNDHTDQALRATADDIVRRLTAATRPGLPVFNRRAWSLLVPLVQAMTLALDKTPTNMYDGPDKNYKDKKWLANDAQLDQLLRALGPELDALEKAPDLQARFKKAFDKFEDGDPDKRLQRLAAMVGLLYEVAAYVK